MPRSAAFTVVELLVVVTIIVVLMALLAPAIDGAMEAASRARCGAQQRAIHGAVWQYTSSNRSSYFICRYRAVQHSISNVIHKDYSKPGDESVDWIMAAATVGLVQRDDTKSGGHTPSSGEGQWHASKLWDCPSTTFKSTWVAGDVNGFNLGYQYMAGILQWGSPFGAPYLNREARAPVKQTRSDGGWVLLADRVQYRRNGSPTWQPNHSTDRSLLLAKSGANHTYVDGSVHWERFADLQLVHSWHNIDSEFHLFRQSDLGPRGLPADASADAVLMRWP